jgi:O-antigen/teichoic acid export membrane protein
MANKKRLAINVVMNWIAMATGMVVPFLLTPFVIRHLGSAAYAVWILAVSTVSYLNLLDLGLRSAIIRYVSKSTTEGNFDEARKAIGAALWFRVMIAAGIGLFSIALAYWFPHIFKVTPDLRRAGQITVLLCALGVAITLVSGVFGGVLSGINRFDVLSSISVTQTLCRALGVFLIIRTGHGLVTLAEWEFTVILLTGLLTWASALRIYPIARVRLTKPDIKTLKMIWAYSFKTFIIIVAVQIVFNTDNIVVGHFLSLGAVTLYSVAGSLAMYSGQVSTAMGSTFIPMASGMDASGNTKDLRKLLIRGTQAALGLMLPIGITLVLRGKTFFGLWMGPAFRETSGTILQILLISQFFTIGNATAGQIAYGIDKHKSVAKWATIEAVFNLSLSLILVRIWGVYGVAWGTSISMSIVHLLFWPRYVKRELGVGIRTYIWQGWVTIVLCSMPFALATWLVDRYTHPGSLVTFFAQILLVLPVYFLSVLVLFHRPAFDIFKRWRSSRMVQQGVA